MSWKAEVVADSSGNYHSNALRFETRKEAERYADDLAYRWTAVRKWRVAESGDPVTHTWDGGAIPKGMHKFTDANGPGE